MVAGVLDKQRVSQHGVQSEVSEPHRWQRQRQRQRGSSDGGSVSGRSGVGMGIMHSARVRAFCGTLQLARGWRPIRQY